MRILVTNSFLASRTGSEMVVRDYTLALKALGHEVVVFSNVLSQAWRRQFSRHGVVAVDRIEDAGTSPDVVHGQHTLAILECIGRFPDTPIVQWIHDRSDPLDSPLRHPAVSHYVAVDEARAQRVRRAGVESSRICVIPNAVDLDRFPLREKAATERRALCIVKREGLEQTAEVVRRVAERQGWTVDLAGAGVGLEIEDMERVLPRYTLVITSGRCALEAIASGAAVIVCDYNRIAGLATEETWAALRYDNLGLDAMTSPITEGSLTEAFDEVELHQAREFSQRVRGSLGLDLAVRAVDHLYRRVLHAHAPQVAGDVRDVWRGDLERLARMIGVAHLAHWRRIADESDARGQSSAE